MLTKYIFILSLLIPIHLYANNVPEKPINVGAYNFTSSTARISFKDMSDNEDGFRIYYQDNVIQNVNAKEGTNSYHYANLDNLKACSLYTIKLVAYNSLGESDPLSKSFRTTGCKAKNSPSSANAGENKSITIGDYIDIVGVGADNDGDRVSDSVKVFVNSSSPIHTTCLSPIDITDYGAVPNDNIDDTSAIESALAVSGCITMPTGVYNVTKLTRSGNSIIDGNGSIFRSERTALQTSNNILTLKTDQLSDRIEIKNLVLDGNCPTQYPRMGDEVASLLHIYDAKNILLENILVKDYSTQYYREDSTLGDQTHYERMNKDHSFDMFFAIFIAFSSDIILKNIEQENIKIEGTMIYDSDNIEIEDFKSKKSVNIWTSLHVVASDNIIMNRIEVSDGLVNKGGSSINFIANHYFYVNNLKSVNKQGFDISNEIRGEGLAGRVTRDTSYGVFENCHFEGERGLYGYPSINKNESLLFKNSKFIPTNSTNSSWGIRLQKSGTIQFDGCFFGSKRVQSRFNTIFGNTDKLIIKNSQFVNAGSVRPLSANIFLYGAEFGDINITNNKFSGSNFTPVYILKNSGDGFGSKFTINEFVYQNNEADQGEFEYGTPYVNGGFKIGNLVTD